MGYIYDSEVKTGTFNLWVAQKYKFYVHAINFTFRPCFQHKCNCKIYRKLFFSQKYLQIINMSQIVLFNICVTVRDDNFRWQVKILSL